ncbi:hypothetical protein DFJ77DRAFT_507444 [Powellomyces hirtus]|nr:hypothetical protein DFJ77DRAFT_507444 [Powellomyces hirtus]
MFSDDEYGCDDSLLSSIPLDALGHTDEFPHEKPDTFSRPGVEPDVDAELEELQKLRDQHQKLRRAKLEREKAKLRAEISQMESEQSAEAPLSPSANPGTATSQYRVPVADRDTVSRLETKRKLPCIEDRESKKVKAGYTQKVSMTRRDVKEEAAIGKIVKSKKFTAKAPLIPPTGQPDRKGRLRPDDDGIESYSGLRLSNRIISVAEMHERMQGRRMVPLHKIAQEMRADDIDGDWVTVGVLFDKSAPRVSAKGTQYCTLRLTDLNKNVINAFLFESCFTKHSENAVGSVVAILNPKILMPNERGKSIALNISSADKWMKIGDSQDVAFCKGVLSEGIKCTRVLDGRRNTHCDLHAEYLFKKARLKRSEFISGNSVFALGDPKDVAKNGRKRAGDQSHGTYLLAGGHAISTGDSGVQIMQPCHAGRKLGLEEQEDVAKMLDSNTPGARYLKAARQLSGRGAGDDPWKPPPVKQIFSVTAMSRMGFDPVSGLEFVPVRTKENAAKAADPPDSAAGTDEMIELELDSDED